MTEVRWGRLALLAGLVLSATRADAAPYTLERLLAKLMVEYPGVLAARYSAEGASAQVSQANRLYFPQGDLSFGITGSPSVQCQTWDPNANSGQGGKADNQNSRLQRCDTTGGYDLRSSDQFLPTHGVAFNLSLNLLQPLYTSGKIESARAAARAGRDAAEGGVEQARAEVRLNAVRSYWGLKAARAGVATLDEGRGKLKEWIARIDKEMDSGKDYSESDLARLKIALDNAELIIIALTRDEKVALAGVRALTGEADAEIDDAEIDFVETRSQPLSYYEDEARLHRPEARLLDAAASAAKSFKRLRLAELLPDFGLAASFSYGYASAVDSPQNAFMSHANFLGAGLFLVMRQPLDFGPRLARLEQASADERAMEARRKQALGGIAWEIASAYANVEEARQRSERLDHAEKVARGWYRAVDDQLSGGAPQTRDLADAARIYFEMRLRHLQSIMDVNVALGQLRRATGVD